MYLLNKRDFLRQNTYDTSVVVHRAGFISSVNWIEVRFGVLETKVLTVPRESDWNYDDLEQTLLTRSAGFRQK